MEVEEIRSAPESSAGRLQVTVSEGLVLDGEPKPEYRESSFLIDFEEPSVVRLVKALSDDRAVSSPRKNRPSLEELERFTDASIEEKNGSRGWDLASRVARDGVGDCTEHAVLLVALARAFGYPARTVQGLALVVPSSAEAWADGIEPGTFGHAWAEIHDGEAWRAVDATRIDRQDNVVVRYLPLGTPENEGPGFRMAVARVLALLPKSVDIR